jgi:hypothetical protein
MNSICTAQKLRSLYQNVKRFGYAIPEGCSSVPWKICMSATGCSSDQSEGNNEFFRLSQEIQVNVTNPLNMKDRRTLQIQGLWEVEKSGRPSTWNLHMPFSLEIPKAGSI